MFYEILKYFKLGSKIIIDFFLYIYVKNKFKFPKVHSVSKTLENILENNLSFARFGDGEFNLISEKSIGFQDGNLNLSKRLQQVLTENQTHCLICIPKTIENLNGLNFKSKIVWMHLIANFYKNYSKFLNSNSSYYNSLITRPYMDLKNKSNSEKYFNLLKQIWENKNIVIVEGEHSKLGVGNDLFDSCLSIQRIITTNSNAFLLYDKIYNEVIKLEKNKLILLALGPTATVLAFDLSKIGYQVGDIGHVDLEYEWFLRSAINKISIKGKHINEISQIPNNNDLISNEYNSQIICKLLK